MNDYRNRAGGTNKAIRAQQELFRQHGYGYMYICPVKEKKERLWELIINNHFRCVRSTEGLIFFLYRLQLEGNSINEVYIHHLRTASLTAIDQLLSCIKGNIKFYIHDYFSICPSIKMMRNDTEYCGSDMMSEKKCKGCKYYKAGIEDNIQLRELFGKYESRLLFIAPSDMAKDVWLKAYESYRDRTIVIYHQALRGKFKKNRKLIRNKIRVGYLGEPSYSKGWNVWNNIIRTVSNKNYQYFYFGKDKYRDGIVHNVRVDFQKDLNAMICSLRQKRVDCVILWSMWEETYSYTFYESLASNAFVITNRKSGNIADQVARRKNVIILDNEKELIDLFKNFELLKMYINNYKESDNYGPDKLVENPEILRYIDAQTAQNVCEVKRRRKTSEEKKFSVYYSVLQIFYYIKKVLL